MNQKPLIFVSPSPPPLSLFLSPTPSPSSFLLSTPSKLTTQLPTLPRSSTKDKNPLSGSVSVLRENGKLKSLVPTLVIPYFLVIPNSYYLQ